MPPGAKKRKALRKKQLQQEAIGTTTNNNGDNLHGGNDEHGSQDDRESDSNLSSPASQENEEFGGTKDASAALVKDTAKEISGVTQGLGPDSGNAIAAVEHEKKTIVENSTQTAKNVASQDPCVKEIAPVVDYVSKVVISEKSKHAETSNLVKQKSDETKEYPSTVLEKDNGKVATLPGYAPGTSKKVESVRESEVPLCSEEKRLLLPGPQAVRTSWLSCCGLFDAMTGSDR